MGDQTWKEEEEEEGGQNIRVNKIKKLPPNPLGDELFFAPPTPRSPPTASPATPAGPWRHPAAHSGAAAARPESLQIGRHHNRRLEAPAHAARGSVRAQSRAAHGAAQWVAEHRQTGPGEARKLGARATKTGGALTSSPDQRRTRRGCPAGQQRAGDEVGNASGRPCPQARGRGRGGMGGDNEELPSHRQ